ncbi:MAG: AAA family ATPase [Moraxella sp.]|uniref:AAA family ATPase n=1 Tax=Moraxella sp. TaxID=479 RepID=UPI0026DC39B7|nr:AAA family ATPase [Moraxella sp.]MDO4449704.1 AAA family ATPase [Moraxella sp.]
MLNSQIQPKAKQLLHELNQIILDKEQVVTLAVSCIFADGHLLLQDLPGMGKTTLAHALAMLLGLDFNRIQFTNDMLPADILGMMIYNQSEHSFTFRKGAVFTQLLLADEINRSSPKTQSALLEAMEEKQVTQDGQTYELPKPFFVIATQNPTQQAGVYPLPESQLDRFLMCVSLGYPSLKAERELLEGQDRRAMLSGLTAILTPDEVRQAQQEVQAMYIAPVVLDYIQRLVAKTRSSREYHGLSPRGVLALKRACQAHAYVLGQDNVSIDDVQAVFMAVADHRLGQRFVPFHHLGGLTKSTIAGRILDEVAVD